MEIVMENMRNFIKQNLRLILFSMCGILVVSGILVVVFGGGGTEGALSALFTAFGIVLIVLGCSLVFYASIIGAAEQENFFLYDSHTKTNITPDELDFDRINRKMTQVMAALTTKAAQVWTENIFENDNEVFEEDDSFIPLVAYKILYDLHDKANDSVWNLYLIADASIIDSIVKALEQNEDYELGKAFKFLHSNAAGSYERTEKFLSDNKRYIQSKMVKYVKANINRF